MLDMLIKSLGLDPDEIQGQATDAIAQLKRVVSLLENIERQNRRILQALSVDVEVTSAENSEA